MENTNEMRNYPNIYGALIKFQSICPIIKTSAEVEVQTLKGGKYKFKYAELSEMIRATQEARKEANIGYYQTIDEEKSLLITYLVATDGSSIRSSIPFPDYIQKAAGARSATSQEIGSQVSYFKRYGLALALGLVSDEDDDANLADGNNMARKPAQSKPTTPLTLLQIKKILSEEGVKADGEALEFLAGIGVEIQDFNLSELELKNILTKLLIHKNESKNKQNNQTAL